MTWEEWFEVMKRTEEERLDKRVNMANVDGNKRRGKPQSRLRDVARELLMKKGAECGRGISRTGARLPR